MHGPAEDHHSQEKQLQKEAPRCDEMWPDLRWVRNKGRGEDGGLSAQVTELPILERSFLLPAFSKGLAPPSKGRPHKLDPRGARRVEQSQGPPEASGHKLQGHNNSESRTKFVFQCWMWSFQPCCDTVSPVSRSGVATGFF